MSSLNTSLKRPIVHTHEGGHAVIGTPLDQLRRTVMACMLWEDNFYEDGEAVADRIKRLVHQMHPANAAMVAIEARDVMKLRHVPLLIVREMARHPRLKEDPRVVSQTLAHIIQRADELTEFLAIYWKDGKQPLSKQVKLGLAKAFQKFSEYDLAKYNRSKAIKLRDVLFLCHSKPADVQSDATPWDKHARDALKIHDPVKVAAQARPDGFSQGELLYGKLIYDQLETPDTWEVELSKGGDKSAAWARLLNEKKLGDLAFLRNLRNMKAAGISDASLGAYGEFRKWGRVLPFRFVAAAAVVPSMENHLEAWMTKCMENLPKLKGRTLFLIDVSGSMFGTTVSAKSDLDRFDAAAALSILGRELCEDVAFYSFSTNVVQVPPRRGFALRDALRTSQQHGGTYLGQALDKLHSTEVYDRIIVLTDEQSADTSLSRLGKTYIINVGGNERSVKLSGDIVRISGWSEAVFDYIQLNEG